MDFQKAREEMVNSQIKARGISDSRVIEAMLKVPREKFVPKEFIEFAYDDSPLSIGEGQTISQPYMVALMTEKLNLQGTEKVLEVGTGSGYQTAILAELARFVISIERIETLAKLAEARLLNLGYKNIKIICGDGTLGYSPEQPYDRILVTAGAPHIPKALLEQLVEGGRLVIPVGDRYSQTLVVVEKVDNEFKTESVCSCIFVPLLGDNGWKNEC